MKLFLYKSLIFMVIMAVLGSLVPLAFAQDETGNTAQVTVVHDMADNPPVDVYIGQVAGTPVVATLANGEESASFEVEAGEQTVFVVPSGARKPVLIEQAVEVEAGKTYKWALTLADDGTRALNVEAVEAAAALGNILEVAGARNDLTTLVTAAGFVGLESALTGEGPITIFAPSDTAFNANPDVVNALISNLDLAQKTLQYHVVPGSYTASQLLEMDGQTLVTAEGSELTVTVADSVISVNGIPVVVADVMASNGVIHIIDGILTLPAAIEPTPEPTQEPTAEPTEEPTLEPTPEPTEAPTEVPTPEPTVEPTAVPTEVAQGPGNILEVVGARNNLTTLTAAAGLIDLSALAGEGPFTLFAPSDDAFNANPDLVNTLISSIDLAQKTLQYHVVPGTYTSEQLLEMDGQTLVTAEGSELTITVADGVVSVNGIAVVEADIEASNGVIHIIDGILTLPVEGPVAQPTEEGGPTESIAQLALANADFSTLVSLVQSDPVMLEHIATAEDVTVFAPPNAAFEQLGRLVETWRESPERLQVVLLSHIVRGTYTLEQLAQMDGAELSTLKDDVTLTVVVEGSDIYLVPNGNTLRRVKLSTTEVPATNGNIIVIEGVIRPTVATPSQ